MFRHAAAVVIVVCLSPSWLHAQNTLFTVIGSANVHKAPSTGAAIIGQAPNGAVFKVTRELGSWVRIDWPAAEDGIGYLHASWGRISNGSMPATRSVSPVRGPSASASPSSASIGVQGNRPGTIQQPLPTELSSTSSATPHLIGIGGLGNRMGSTLGLGASGRAWFGDRFGIQLNVARYAPTSAVAGQRQTTMQVAPSVLYSLPDKLTDYVWFQPYVGGGLTIHRSTFNSGTPGVEAITDSGMGRQLFGGTAVAFASAPRFTLSVDYGYRWNDEPLAPFAGLDLSGKGVSISGHWYVR